ncbi:endonuclease/exonuclease/phosphatase family protein [Phenylobacterium sp.]|jgi:endonuclease/exonuclease/phosphatase (EEP) superfamily protein YafD|uniref:endonuclease/exonuclease/phosphatase family protein n=1 Tax=Phenylobacterium sp. TaxID=1871053 RepID=UPI002F416AF1
MRFVVILFSSLVASAALGMGFLCAAGAVLAWGGRADGRLDILAHFAPFWFAGGLAATVTALCLRPPSIKAALLIPGVVAMVAAGGLIVPELIRRMSPRVAPDAPHQIKLIQFNTWNRNVDPEGTARWIVGEDPDIVVIEEAQPPVLDAIRRLKRYQQSGSRSSVVILSKAPQASNVLPRPRGRGPHAVLALATFATADGGFTVVGVHYAWPTLVRMQAAQAADLARVLDGFDHSRLIVAGDFNSTPWSFARRRDDARFGLERRTRALFSWPARNSTGHRLLVVAPFLPIDHVYAGPAWRTVSVRRGPKLGSDHYPVVVRLALAP